MNGQLLLETNVPFLVVSVASVWELILKHETGKLQWPWTILPVKPEQLAELLKLPLIHRDPFDRLLIAQARSEGLTIVTPDEQIGKYEIHTLW